jgi:exosortase
MTAAGSAKIQAGGPRLLLVRAALAVGLTACLAWAYWPTFAALVRRWSEDSQASHGFLVPVFALFLLWHRRDRMPSFAGPLCWWGVVWLEVAGLMRLAGAWFAFDWLDAISLIPALAGCLVLLGGTGTWRWSWPALVFLQFMVPWPYQLEISLAAPLQRLATLAGTYALQTLGYPAVDEGNIILIDDLRIGVLEACNGLGMLFAFFALSTAIALVIDRRLTDRVVIFLSAIPVGVLVNLIRITATAVAVVHLHDEKAFHRFHDLAGWLMMPVALALLWAELKLLDWLFVPVGETGPVPFFLPAASPPHAKQLVSETPVFGPTSAANSTLPDCPTPPGSNGRNGSEEPTPGPLAGQESFDPTDVESADAASAAAFEV